MEVAAIERHSQRQGALSKPGFPRFRDDRAFVRQHRFSPISFLAKNFLTPDDTPSAPSLTRTAELTALAADSLRGSGRLRLRVRGQSMLPILWPGDVVEIASCSVDDVRPGDIVLVLLGDRFVLHRFLARSQANGFLLRGDSMPGPDPQFPSEALLGRLVSRSGQNHQQARTRPFLPLRLWSRAIGQLLCYCGPARWLVLKLHDRRRRDARKIQNARGDAKLGAVHGRVS